MTCPDQPRTPNFDPAPVVPIAAQALVGDALWAELDGIARSRRDAPVVVLDCYPGADRDGLVAHALAALPGYRHVDVEEAALPIDVLDAKIADHLTDDRVFGVMSRYWLHQFYDAAALAALREDVAACDEPILLTGWGAALAAPDDAARALVDMARWEIQLRMRKGMGNWRCDNGAEDQLRKYKRGFFVEWRTADRHKVEHWESFDVIVDGNAETPAGLRRADVDKGLDTVAARPFRVVPYFDQGIWGGQWMKEVLGLETETPNYAWCFDCVPEENSLVLRADGADIELPAMDLVQLRPRQLLGLRTFARFGAEFPIRFDFLDTMQGGNLSLQVHPRTDYINQHFGISYTQDESYYLLDCTDDAKVYLGLRDDVDPDEFAAALRRAQTGVESLAADDFVNSWPARRHDHFLIPAGTTHCSGADSMVLEISATPYIFTFKMWDWGRVGVDGIPRPVHVDHALANIDWSRRTDFAREQLCNIVDPIGEGDGWREERTGLHELEFIETRRHWFTGPVTHDTAGTVNVLNLVQGASAVVSSPTGAFEPWTVHYAETFIVPAAVGEYTITPGEDCVGECATLKAYVRGTQR